MIVYFSPPNNSLINGHIALPKSVVRFILVLTTDILVAKVLGKSIINLSVLHFSHIILRSSLSPCPKSCPKSCSSPNPCPRSTDMCLSEPVSEDTTLSNGVPMSESEVQKILCPCPGLLRTRTRTRTHVRSRVRVRSSLQ